MTEAPPPPPNYGPPSNYGPPPAYQPKRKTRFYQRWLFWVPAAIIVIIIASVSAGGSGSKNTASGTSPTTPAGTTPHGATHATSKAPSPSVSRGVGSKDASGDVKIGRLTVDKVLGMPKVIVTVTNHSSKRSDYAITLALESADGRTQLDTADVFVQNLEPGQSSRQEGDFFSARRVPTGAMVVLQEVERTASV